MNLWWNKNLVGGVSGETFPGGRDESFLASGGGTPSFPQIEKTMLSRPPPLPKKKSVKNFKPPIWLSSSRG